ncbi:MAG: ArsR/SmtB family transcription factor [Steroidobacteraceae bacterium]
MKPARVVDSLGALAHEHRLAIYRLLIKQGPEGMPAGAIGGRVGLTPSSLTFHLQTLQAAGLVKRVRVSRQQFYSADFAAMNGLVGYLTEECCIEGSGCAPECQPAPVSKKQRIAKVA